MRGTITFLQITLARDMSFYSFNCLKKFFKPVFILCDKNEVVTKLHTSTCSFVNKLKEPTKCLIVWKFLSSVHFGAGMCRKLCNKFKFMQNLIETVPTKSFFYVFCGGTAFRFGFLWRSPMRLVTSAFSNWGKRCRKLSFSSSYILSENTTSGMSSPCGYQICKLNTFNPSTAIKRPRLFYFSRLSARIRSLKRTFAITRYTIRLG